MKIQAPVLARYPASLSVTAYSYLFGVMFLVSTAFFMNNESTDWSLTESEFWAVLYAVSIFLYSFFFFLFRTLYLKKSSQLYQ